MADGLSPDGAGPQFYVLWEVFSGTPIGGMLIDQADETHLSDWLTGCRDLIGDLPVLALLSDKEKALVAAMGAVWPQAAHQLCQMHFMQNLSGPVHRADQTLRQTLRDRIGELPAVPELEPEAAVAQIEQLVPGQDTAGEKRGP
jgi:DNA recombination-dependent growth factor C